MKNQGQMKNYNLVNYQMMRSQLTIQMSIESCVRQKMGVISNRDACLLAVLEDLNLLTAETAIAVAKQWCKKTVRREKKFKSMLLMSLLPSISNDDLEQSQTDAFKGILSQLSVLLDKVSVTAMNVLDTKHNMEWFAVQNV